MVRTYLALDDPSQFRPAPDVEEVTFALRAPCPVPLYRALYRDVGERWYWHERRAWSDDRLAARLATPGVAVWEALVGPASAGYFELERHDDGGVEIVYFGLKEAFIGRGIGGAMLTRAVREAHAMGATRVWLHTCTLDSPNALPAYQARGFRPFRTERLAVELDGTRVVSERLIPA